LHRLTVNEDLSVYLKEAYLLLKKLMKILTGTPTFLTNILKSTGLDNKWDSTYDHCLIHPNLLINELRQCLTDMFIQEWHTQLRSTTEKLRMHKETKAPILSKKCAYYRISNHPIKLKQEGIAHHLYWLYMSQSCFVKILLRMNFIFCLTATSATP